MSISASLSSDHNFGGGLNSVDTLLLRRLESETAGRMIKSRHMHDDRLDDAHCDGLRNKTMLLFL